jgi:hypothetical protein
VAIPIYLSAVKTLETGMDGGHLYIKGRGDVPGQGECDIYAHFRTKKEEREFESQFNGQNVVIVAESLEFTRGIGGSVNKILSWRFK